MPAKKINWHKAADSKNAIDWQENKLAIVETGGKKITLASFNNEISAFAHKCPHAGGIMADGYIDATGNVACPLHRFKFSIKNGRNVSGEGYYLKVYPVDEREDGIFIGFEENSWLDMFR